MISDIDRRVLPMPDHVCTGPVTYDAKCPATSFAPIEPIKDSGHLSSPEERLKVALARQ